MVPAEVSVVIVGAGLSGLIAANRLAGEGIRAVVLDKAKSAGGRLATRRLGSATARADSGAQFFTVRSPDFADLVHDWRRAGLVHEWCRGFTSGGDGHPRYSAIGGMNTVGRYLASTVDVETDVTVQTISPVEGGYLVEAVDGAAWKAPIVLVSAPVPQSLDLIDRGKCLLPSDIRELLNSVHYARCFALLLRLDGSSNVPEPGGVQLTIEQDPVFSFVADNQSKGISDVTSLTLHTHDQISLDLWDQDRTLTSEFLTKEAKRWIGSAAIVESYVHGWKFARPISTIDSPFLIASDAEGRLLGFIGDAFGGSKVEGAALSGLAAAEALVGVL